MKLDSLIAARDLTAEQIRHLISFSLKIKKSPDSYANVLKGKTVIQFFVENSTRTKTSFEMAARKLGGASMGFAATASSLAKGETLLDTVQALRQYGGDLIVIRHHFSGAPHLLRQATGMPVVNAGDGTHEHPTQALLDATTMVEQWGGNPEIMIGKKIMIIGDIQHSRVARSNIHLLSKLGAKVTVCAPLTLLPNDMSLFPKVELINRLDNEKGLAALSESDAVIALRIQFERQHGKMHLPSKSEYRHFWGLTIERAKFLKPKAIVMHPGPVNRGLEIDPEVADSASSLALKQVENGVWSRMAVLASILAPESAKGVQS